VHGQVGRWVAKSAARLLGTAALWVRIQTSPKKTKWATSAKEWPTQSSPPKKCTKNQRDTLLREVENKLKANCSKFSLSGNVGVSADVPRRRSGRGGGGVWIFVQTREMENTSTIEVPPLGILSLSAQRRLCRTSQLQDHRVGQRRDSENFSAFTAGAYTTT
jgi:hypothetical protein